MHSKPIHEASFKVRTTAFPGHPWREFYKAFKAKQSSRGIGPAWDRIAGPGFTLWHSDVILLDRTTEPPTWEIRLESLASLNTVGGQCWQAVCQGIVRFFQQSGLEGEASSA